MKKLVASIMCADTFHIEEELNKCLEAGLDWLHCDVMDGIFVDNLAMGPYNISPIIKTKKFTTDVHLACVEPKRYIEMFSKIHPDYITFHIEAVEDIKEHIELIRSKGVRVGLAVSPQTEIERIYPYLEDIDLILMMCVNPGFAGQSFQMHVLDKIFKVQKEIEKCTNKPLIEVDGNIKAETIQLIEANGGANLFVLGTSALFKNDGISYKEKAQELEKIFQ